MPSTSALNWSLSCIIFSPTTKARDIGIKVLPERHNHSGASPPAEKRKLQLHFSTNKPRDYQHGKLWKIYLNYNCVTFLIASFMLFKASKLAYHCLNIWKNTQHLNNWLNGSKGWMLLWCLWATLFISLVKELWSTHFPKTSALNENVWMLLHMDNYLFWLAVQLEKAKSLMHHESYIQ